jgi:hypothetical protein
MGVDVCVAVRGELVQGCEDRLAIELVVSGLESSLHWCYCYLYPSEAEAAQC